MSIGAFFLRPETKIREWDYTTQPNALPTSIGCVVAEFDKGPLDPTYTSGSTDIFYSLYGSVANPGLSYGHDTIQQFLTQSNNCLVKRVVNGALHAGYHLFMSSVFSGSSVLKSIRNVPFNVGTTTGYASGIVPPTLLEFNADLVTANSFAMSITDGAAVTPVGPVVFATSHAQTLTAIATAIATVVATFGSGGGAVVLPNTGATKGGVIAVYPPKNATITLVSPVVTLGASQPTVTQITPENGWLGSLIAENPGTWANDIGYKIQNIDKGLRQRIRLTFSNKLVTANTFDMKINDVAITQVTYATSSDATLAAIAVAITAHADVYEATVEQVAAGVDNDRSIVIVANNAGPDQIAVSNIVVAGGASQASVLPTTVRNGTVPSGLFDLFIYSRSNVASPIERYNTSFSSKINGNGGQTRIDSLMNMDSRRSDNVRFIPNARIASDSAFANTVDTYISDSELVINGNITWLVGGDKGTTALTSQIRNAIADLDDRTIYPFNILMNAGYHAVEIKKELASLAEKRRDCFAILDMPSNNQKVLDARIYRQDEIDLDTSYAMLVTPDVLIADSSTGERRFIPPSGMVGALFAKSDREVNIAAAPAGPNRGVIRNALGLRQRYKAADEELLFPIGVSCIIDRPGAGPTLMGEQTLQVRNSILRNVSARRLVSHLEVSIADGVDYALFEPHNEFTRNQVSQIARSVLQPYVNSGDLLGFRIQCDEKNNPPDLVDNGILNLRVILKVTPKVKGIMLDVVLIKTGATFEEFEVDAEQYGL